MRKLLLKTKLGHDLKMHEFKMKQKNLCLLFIFFSARINPRSHVSMAGALLLSHILNSKMILTLLLSCKDHKESWQFGQFNLQINQSI